MKKKVKGCAVANTPAVSKKKDDWYSTNSIYVMGSQTVG